MTEHGKSLAAGAAFIDGGYVPIEEAKLPLLDWGFLRGDANQDTISAWRGSFFRLEDHLDRFFANLESLRMTCPLSREAVREVVFELVRRTGLREAYVQLVDTRGMPPIGSRDPRQCVNRFQAFCIPYVWIATREKQRTGLAMHVSERWRVPAQSGWILFRRRLICELARQGRVTVISKHMWCYCMACRRSRIDMWYCFLVRPSLSSRDGRVRMRIRLHQETSRPLALIGKLVIECSLYPDQACPRPSRG